MFWWESFNGKITNFLTGGGGLEIGCIQFEINKC